MKINTINSVRIRQALKIQDDDSIESLLIDEIAKLQFPDSDSSDDHRAFSVALRKAGIPNASLMRRVCPRQPENMDWRIWYAMLERRDDGKPRPFNGAISPSTLVPWLRTNGFGDGPGDEPISKLLRAWLGEHWTAAPIQEPPGERSAADESDAALGRSIRAKQSEFSSRLAEQVRDEREPEWAKWWREAEKIRDNWTGQKPLSQRELARRVKKNLNLSDSDQTIKAKLSGFNLGERPTWLNG